MKPGKSMFAKYDLRDGFWLAPTHPSSRPHLMVRHPGTGRLLWCRSLPFGYLNSPLHFCDLTEQVAHLWRKRMSALTGDEARFSSMVHMYVFVDDYLLVGDDPESTRVGMREFESLLAELGARDALGATQTSRSSLRDGVARFPFGQQRPVLSCRSDRVAAVENGSVDS